MYSAYVKSQHRNLGWSLDGFESFVFPAAVRLSNPGHKKLPSHDSGSKHKWRHEGKDSHNTFCCFVYCEAVRALSPFTADQ